MKLDESAEMLAEVNNKLVLELHLLESKVKRYEKALRQIGSGRWEDRAGSTEIARAALDELIP